MRNWYSDNIREANEAKIIDVLEDFGPLTMAEIEEETKLPYGTIWGRIKRLIATGHVKKLDKVRRPASSHRISAALFELCSRPETAPKKNDYVPAPDNHPLACVMSAWLREAA